MIASGSGEVASATVTLPVTVPALAGAKVTDRLALCPGARVSPAGTPLALKPAPEILTLDTDNAAAPALVMLTERVLVVPVFTLPKLILACAAVSPSVVLVPAAPTHPDKTTADRSSASRL